MTKFLTTFLTALFLWTMPAFAHFLTDSQSRELHLMPDPEGVAVLLRFPATLAFAAALAEPFDADGLAQAAYLAAERIGERPVYAVDLRAAQEDRDGFAAYLLKDYRFTADGAEITPTVEGWTVTEGVWSPGLDSIETALAQPDSAIGALIDTDIALRVVLPGVAANAPITVEVTTPKPEVPAELVFDTHVTDHRISPPVLISAEGFQPAPITASPAPGSAFLHWVMQGVEHIVGGLDHVLFVLCLALAAPSLRALAWSVTGFTLGHSVTLSLGTMGYVPDVPWFIPAVELGVALSIVAMALLVMFQRAGSMRFTLAAGLGLLHGFGFAFMLTPMIGRGGLFVPLAGFNIGVELGQLVIVCLAFALITWASFHAPKLGKGLRLFAATCAAAVALMMVIDRIGGLMESLAA